MSRCFVCGETRDLDEFDACGDCVATFGRVLIKATVDPFDYMVGLRDGRMVRFNLAEIRPGGWLLLTGDGRPVETDFLPRPERGIHVRVSDIVWACDAPEGS
jgi:hypothetical protein